MQFTYGGSSGTSVGGASKFKFRCSYTVGGEGCGRHRFGVNALASSPDGSLLYSGGRDATVRAWSVGGGCSEPQLAKSFEHHIHWVNDLAVSSDGILMTASSDTTVKLWDAERTNCVKTLVAHSDYVTALAYSPSTRLLASAGLDRRIFLWDLDGGVAGEDLPAADLRGHKDSIYSLGVSAAAAVLVSGATDQVLRVWDIRIGGRVCKLKGHLDNIRAVVVSDDGREVLSGSSDGTIRLWDVGLRKCVQTLSVHEDSVWALAANEAFSTVYSGGRDGAVFATALAYADSECVCREAAPVLSLLPAADGAGLWVSTTQSSIHLWSLTAGSSASRRPAATAAAAAAAASGTGGSSGDGGSGGDGRTTDRSARSAASGSSKGETKTTVTSVETTPPPRGGHSIRIGIGDTPMGGVDGRYNSSSVVLDGSTTTSGSYGDDLAPLALRPTATIAGLPGLIRHKILSNRRHVLTLADDGNVQLWDVTKGENVRDFGKVDFEETIERVDEKVVVANWLSVDTRLGVLSVHLRQPQCFDAEVYARDAGIEEFTDGDVKINMGHSVLLSLFRNWRMGRLRRFDEEAGVDTEKKYKQTREPRDLRGSEYDAIKYHHERNRQALLRRIFLEQSDIDDETLAIPVVMFPLPENTPFTVTVDSTGQSVFRSRISDSNGYEPYDVMPFWITDAVLKHVLWHNGQSKLNFVLVPHESCDLPELPENLNRLSAAKILKISKVASYVSGRLEFDGELEILCNGVVLDGELDLQTTRHFAWKAFDDLTLTYRPR